jgi:lipoprotein-anchoring transpeptidase ErfK/SrfK
MRTHVGTIVPIAITALRRTVLKQRVIVLCAVIGTIIATILGASPDVQAQGCDDRYPMSCRGFGPPQPAVVPLAPQMILPQRLPEPELLAPAESGRPGVVARPADPAVLSRYAGVYAGTSGEPFPIPAVDLSQIDPQFLRRTVSYPTSEPPGTIVIDPANRFLYLVQDGGQAIRYGVGVGREGFGWSGIANVHEKREWPDWYPPKEMIQRQPDLRRQLTALQSGIGMSGGPRNPLGARALYLWQGNKDTLFRIHGTLEPWTIGSSVSSGCIRMINQDVIDLYQRAPINTKVVVLGARS